MNSQISDNSKAILLLAAPLLVGAKQEGGAKILTASEYNQLAKLLRERNAQPSDLLSSSGTTLLADLRTRFDTKRLETLLARGFLLSQAVEQWGSRAISVISRADPEYPRRLKSKLGHDAPPVLYGCGDWSLLNNGGLAVVGSRHVDDAILESTRGVGRLCASANRILISGGAKGIDRAAMDGALSSDGTAVGIMADRLSQAVVARDSREWIRENRLTLISPFDPSAGFNVGNAMARNKLIYAIADAALVMNSDFQKGGTWAGAIEQIERYRACPVFVRATGEVPKGNLKLVEAGAKPWPEPKSPEALVEVLQTAASQQPSKPDNESLLPGLRMAEEPQPPAPKPLPTPIAHERSPAQTVIAAVQTALRAHLKVPMTAKDIAILLDVQPKQGDLWLTRFCEEGWICKTKKPVRYILAESTEDTLFNHQK